MKTTYSFLAIIAIIFSMMIIVPSELTQTVDATKATGVKNPKYGQATYTTVCGDKLCTLDDFAPDGTKKEYTHVKSSINSDIVWEIILL